MASGMTTDDLIDMLNSQSDEAYAAGYSHWGHTMSDAVDAIAREVRRAAWFKQRCDALQDAQKHMRDPERKMVCDILANGKTFERSVEHG